MCATCVSGLDTNFVRFVSHFQVLRTVCKDVRHGIAALIMNDEHVAYYEESGYVLCVYATATMQCIYTHTFVADMANITRCIVFCAHAQAVITGHRDGCVRVHILPRSSTASSQDSIRVQLMCATQL